MLLLVLASFAYAESNEQTSLTEWTSLGLTKENKLFFQDKLKIDSPHLAKRAVSLSLNKLLEKAYSTGKTDKIDTADKLENILNTAQLKYTKAMCTISGTLYGVNCTQKAFSEAVDKGIFKTFNMDNGKMPINIHRVGYSEIYIPLSAADPYHNQEGFYIFMAELIQRIDRTHAFFKDNNALMYIELPEGNYHEGGFYGGVAKGEGSYKYETVDGRHKIIPKGIVIAIEDFGL